MKNKIFLIVLLIIIMFILLSTKITPVEDTVHKVVYGEDNQYEKDKERYRALRQLIESCDPVIINHKLWQVCV